VNPKFRDTKMVPKKKSMSKAKYIFHLEVLWLYPEALPDSTIYSPNREIKEAEEIKGKRGIYGDPV
jgi:hypothetical protein